MFEVLNVIKSVNEVQGTIKILQYKGWNTKTSIKTATAHYIRLDIGPVDNGYTYI